jgi:glycerol-3-phosphate dehydrogenase (NAD(P)+)
MVLEPVSVIGAGSWGTALVKPLSSQARDIYLWGHRREHVESLIKYRENKTYLPGFHLPENVFPVDSLEAAVKDKRYIIMVVPSHVFREVFQQMVSWLRQDAIVVSAVKGIENESLLTMTQVMAEELPDPTAIQLGALAGPSFAREVALDVPTAVTVSSPSPSAAKEIQNIFSTERFRVYTSTDLIGLELGGALKNIIAIAAGICDGLGYGTNTRAALITRGLAEITRIGVAMGASPHTFAGLGGLGDLVLTCTGDLSRNRTVGLKLGQGKKLETILAEMEMVAEGVKTTLSVRALAKKMGVEMPILEQVYLMLYEDKPCRDAVGDLLARDPKEELG